MRFLYAKPSRALAILLAAALGGCAAAPADDPGDPWEDTNRSLFSFNLAIDDHVLEPTARGWNAITADPVQYAFERFFANLRFPVSFVNNLLQAKVEAAGSETARFVINSTVGLAGFFDPAASWGLEAKPEDFGQTLGRWGVGPGPYVMLPFLGPSDSRDAPSLLADWALDPLVAAWPLWIISVVNARTLNLDLIADNRESALDFYVFVRSTYRQDRRNLVRDTTESDEDEEDYDDYDDYDAEDDQE